MRGALVHGILLAVMLVYGYRTWTRDKTVEPNVGSVVLWDRGEGDLVSIEYKQETKIVKLEKRGSGADTYWWGSETTIERKPKPPKPGAEGSGSAAGSAMGSAGSAMGSAGSGSAAAPPPPPIEYEEIGRKTREFPVGEAAEKLVKSYAAARALRDLGKPNDEQKKDYKLVDAKTQLAVTFKDGPHTFTVGGSVYGGSDKYAVDDKTGKAYVLSRDLVSSLEIGESSLHLLDPKGFDAAKIGTVTIEAGSRSKIGMRITTTNDGHEAKTWGDPDTKKGNQTLANFIDNANNLKPTEYNSTLTAKDLTPVVRLTYKDEAGRLLGTLALYKHEKSGTVPEGQTLDDPANPPKGETEYYIITEKTRVPGLVRKDTAQRTENDIDTVMNSKAGDVPAGAGSGGSIPGKPIDPKGNPFGPTPPGAIPHGAPPVPPPAPPPPAPHAGGSGAPAHAP